MTNWQCWKLEPFFYPQVQDSYCSTLSVCAIPSACFCSDSRIVCTPSPIQTLLSLLHGAARNTFISANCTGGFGHKLRTWLCQGYLVLQTDLPDKISSSIRALRLCLWKPRHLFYAWNVEKSIKVFNLSSAVADSWICPPNQCPHTLAFRYLNHRPRVKFSWQMT